MIPMNIPGFGKINIKHVVLDYNGTIALDGKLIKGVKEGIKKYSRQVKFHVITADTFGFVEKELQNIDAVLTIIPKENQAQRKRDYIRNLGADQTLCAGNGSNDRMMLKEAGIGIAVSGKEGLATSSLGAADLLVTDVLDIFGFFQTPERLIACLRT
ncbi:MAG: ATPase P [Desulfobacteraceae bacterium 4572_89]|nr:MAG: ATPase P [Desulfobacteraceae bacterium 4572_89]